MNRLFCTGCCRPLGVFATAQMRSAVWCSEHCAGQPVAGVNEMRDDVMTELSRAGRTDGEIGTLFGLHRTRVQRIIAKRDPRAQQIGA